MIGGKPNRNEVVLTQQEESINKKKVLPGYVCRYCWLSWHKREFYRHCHVYEFH